MGGGGSFIRTGFWDTGGLLVDPPRFWPNRFDRMLMDWAWPGFFNAGTTLGGGGLGGGAFLTWGATAELPNGVSSQLVAGLYRFAALLDDACGGGGAGRDGIVIFLLIWQTDHCDDDDDG